MSTAPAKVSIKSLVLRYLEEFRPAEIDEDELSAVCRYVTKSLSRQKPVSRHYVVDLLSETEVAIAPSLGGLPIDLRGRVHAGDPSQAASSLLDLQREYSAARAQGDTRRAEDCRRAVRQAKDRLKLVLRRPNLSPEKQEEKRELLQWFLTWLETPELFDQWLALRLRNDL